jgi:uncharacterized SAM-binding protein YcdF (DUF218 family)
LEEETLMFFVFSKTVAFLALPSNFLLLLCFIGIVLTATRLKRAGWRLALASLVVLALAGFTPIGNVLMHALESRFPSWDPARGPPDGIVVLGGAINPIVSLDHGEPVVNGSADRIIAIARLARQFPNARIIFSSGDAALFPKGPAEADFLYPLLDDFGVPRARVTLERRSRNTAENAAFSKDIASPKPGERWLLVTSAMHMPRAVGCFRSVGFPVEAYPVDWRTLKRANFFPSLSFASGLARTDFALHEWIGLLAYWATGRTSELLPRP